MANVPIVTEVTKAELDALVAANELNEGLQYKVTDKGWLLIATSVNTLLDVDNIIRITNGDLLPSYIDSNQLIIDTGILTGDLSTGFLIHVPANYYVQNMRTKNLNEAAIPKLEVYDDQEEGILFKGAFAGLGSTLYDKAYPGSGNYSLSTNGKDLLVYIDDLDTNTSNILGVQLLFLFSKSVI